MIILCHQSSVDNNQLLLQYFVCFLSCLLCSNLGDKIRFMNCCWSFKPQILIFQVLIYDMPFCILVDVGFEYPYSEVVLLQPCMNFSAGLRCNLLACIYWKIRFCLICSNWCSWWFSFRVVVSILGYLCSKN